MSNTLSTARRALAALSAVAFIIVSVPGLVLFSVDRNAFNPALYKRSLAEQGIYQRFPALAAEQVVLQLEFTRSLDESDPRWFPVPPHLQFLTQADYEATLTDLVTPEWAQQTVESAVDQIFVFWNTDVASVPVTVSIVDVKGRITPDAAGRALGRVVGSWPECDLLELLGWGGIVVGAKLEDLPVCRPPDDLVQAVLPIVTGLISEALVTQVISGIVGYAIERVPDELVIMTLPERPEDRPPDKPPLPRESVNLWRWVGRLMPVLSVVLLVVTLVLGARSIQGFFLWAGVPLFLAGLAGALVAVAAFLSLPQIGANVAAGALLPPTSPGIETMAQRLAEDVARVVVIWTGVGAAVMAGLGLVMALIGGVAGLWLRPSRA